MPDATDRGVGAAPGLPPRSHALDAAGEQPYARKKYLEIDGYRMAYIDEGEGDAIVFQHGNPTSSYLWRNVMGASAGSGRVIACDLIGMGDSDKLDPALGPGRYSFETQRRFLFALWDALGLGDRVVLVLHDVGSMFGFHWANTHRDRVQGIVYMEAIVAPLRSTDFPEWARTALGELLTVDAERAVLRDNLLLERLLLSAREFSAVERAHYRKPFLIPGEDRRPMLSFEFPVDGHPPHTAEIVAVYSSWLAASDTPKLHIQSEPGYIDTGRLSDLARSWPNQTEVTVAGAHFIQETSPAEIGQAIAEFIHTLRGAASPTGATSSATNHPEELSCP